jgi:hypothetical protein
MASITITLDDGEQAAINQLLDAAVKHVGLGAVQAIGHFLVKFEQAKGVSIAPVPLEATDNASSQ